MFSLHLSCCALRYSDSYSNFCHVQVPQDKKTMLHTVATKKKTGDEGAEFATPSLWFDAAHGDINADKHLSLYLVGCPGTLSCFTALARLAALLSTTSSCQCSCVICCASASFPAACSCISAACCWLGVSAGMSEGHGGLSSTFRLLHLFVQVGGLTKTRRSSTCAPSSLSNGSVSILSKLSKL